MTLIAPPRQPSAGLVVVLALLAAASARADDAPLTLTIQDHRFIPAEIHVPAGQPTLVQVENRDATPEEVESAQLGIEKVVPAHARSRIHLRPLAAGRYPFFGEYHPETAQGAVIAE